MELYYLCCNAIMDEHKMNEHKNACENCCKHAKTQFDL